jgi:hypothetical protein
LQKQTAVGLGSVHTTWDNKLHYKNKRSTIRCWQGNGSTKMLLHVHHATRDVDCPAKHSVGDISWAQLRLGAATEL